MRRGGSSDGFGWCAVAVGWAVGRVGRRLEGSGLEGWGLERSWRALWRGEWVVSTIFWGFASDGGVGSVP